jgi:hypothetical protein
MMVDRKVQTATPKAAKTQKAVMRDGLAHLG